MVGSDLSDTIRASTFYIVFHRGEVVVHFVISHCV